MPNTTNEVIINGQGVMSVRGDTVTENTLVQGETATNKKGEKITGTLDNESKEDINALNDKIDSLSDTAYMINDDEGEITEADYIPFYDVSDEDNPKKKVVLGELSQRIGEQIGVYSPHTYDMGTAIPENDDLDDYISEGVFYVSSNSVAETIANIPVSSAGKLIVMNRDTGARLFQIYIASENDIYIRAMDNSYVFFKWRNIARAHSFELGTDIPTNSDLNTYTTEGVYRIAPDATAITVTNIPQGIAGKLIVVKGVASDANVDKYKEQFYLTYTGSIYKRCTTNSGTSWSEWATIVWAYPKTYNSVNGISFDSRTENGARAIFQFGKDGNRVRQSWYDGTNWSGERVMANLEDVSPAGVGNGYAVATVSGSTITATISGFQLRAGVIVALRFETSVTTDCTLNISNTGAKSVKYWNDEAVSVGKQIAYGVYTFIYDGTYYRVIGNDHTPIIGAQGYVADTSGNLTITWGYGVNRAQIKYRLSSDKLVWNYYKNSAWRGDVIMADYNDLVYATLGTDIPDNANLNSYTTNGIYNISSNARADTITNVPVARAGKLIIQRVAANSYITQIYMTYANSLDNMDGIYKRYSGDNGSTWGGWISTAFIAQGNGMLYLVGKTTTEEDKPMGIAVKITDTTTGKAYAYKVMKAYQDHHATPYGLDLVLDAGGNTIVNGGDTGEALYQLIKDGADERLFLTSDNELYIEANANTIANRQGFVLNTSGKLLPVKAETVTDNFGDIGESSHKLANIWTYKINGQDVINSENIAPALAKVGKSILPSWSYTSNTYTTNGITFTFNPSTGEITANGTATADANCILAGVRYSYYWLGKGSYVLSGCPSGGSSSKYFICLNLNNKDIFDYGSGVSFTLTTDHESVNNEHLYININSGQTVSNLVFKPMLRPAFTTADYEPCEDIHKGNCYVGTCATAGGTKDKVAYVDGYFVLRKGVRVAIKFSNSNTYSSATANPITLNVNDTGAKNIWYWQTHSGAGNTGTNTTIYGYANRYINYYYDGTYWVWEGMSGEANDNQRKSFYGTCSTGASEQVKVVTLADTAGWELRAGTIVGVKFSNSNTYSATADNHVQLNVNNTGAKNIYYNLGYPTGTSTLVFGYANRTHYYMYNGTDWVWISAGTEVDTVDPRSLGFGYGTCATAEATTAKVVTLASYTLRNGGFVAVKFTYAVPANSTMNINNRGAREIWHRGAKITANKIKAGDLATFVYDGTHYQLVANDRYIT